MSLHPQDQHLKNLSQRVKINTNWAKASTAIGITGHIVGFLALGYEALHGSSHEIPTYVPLFLAGFGAQLAAKGFSDSAADAQRESDDILINDTYGLHE